jgi:DNA-directed RNA polymerase subunit K/omega
MDNINQPTMDNNENIITDSYNLEEVTNEDLIKTIGGEDVVGVEKESDESKKEKEKEEEKEEGDEDEDEEKEDEDEEEEEEEKEKEENFENIEEEEEESDSDESSDEDESYFRKIENDNKKDILLDYHPEIQHLKTTEMLAMTKIYRNEHGIISDELHKTSPILTRFEKARIIGLRAKQINMGAEPFIEISDDIIDGLTIAEMELKEKKIPFIIRRPMPNGGSEYWNLKDLILLQ